MKKMCFFIGIHFPHIVLCYRSVGKTLRNKKSQSMAAQCFVERLVEKNIISMNSELIVSSVKQCLFCKPDMEITKHCNNISFLSDREVSYNNRRHCLVMKLHQDMFCRPKNIQNILLNLKQGIRSIHNLSSTDLFGSGDNVQKITKLSGKETDSTSHEEENNLKLKVKTAKGFYYSRKQQGSSENIKGGKNKTTDDLLEGEKSEDITSEGMHCVTLSHVDVLGMHVKSV